MPKDTGYCVAHGYKVLCCPWIQDTVLPMDRRCTVTQGSGQMIQDTLLPVIEGALLHMDIGCTVAQEYTVAYGTVDTVAYGYRMHCCPWYRMH